MTTILAAGIFGSLVMIFVGLGRLLTPQGGRLDQRLQRYGARREVVVDAETGETRATTATSATVTGAVSRMISGRSFAANLQADLARADIKMTAGEFVTLQACLGLLPGILLALILQNVLAVVVFGLVGFYGPKWWLGNREGARLKAFGDQLADTISLMSNSLRSGMSLLQAMEMLSREGAPPTSVEYARVVREIGLGVGPDDALLHLVRRIQSDDLDLMVTAIMVQHEVGGNLSKILDTIAHTIRERVKIKGEIRSITAQQRMAGYILAGLPIFVGGVLSLIAPSYVGAFINPMGPWTALPVGAIISAGIGFVVIQKIVEIDV